jgi:hypothetical protein
MYLDGREAITRGGGLNRSRKGYAIHLHLNGLSTVLRAAPYWLILSSDTSDR